MYLDFATVIVKKLKNDKFLLNFLFYLKEKKSEVLTNYMNTKQH